MYYIDSDGNLYTGDMQPGDRVATADEIRARLGEPVENARTTKLAEIMAAYQAAFAPIEAVYPVAEREGWPVQEAEAKAVLADPTAETPVLSLLVQLRGRGEAVPELAAKVLHNAGQWRTLYAYLTGQQQHMYAEVSALETLEDIQAYPVEYQLPGGM